MLWSIIIVSYNTKEILGRCLDSLPSGLEVIVVDNGSKDGSAEFLAGQNIKKVLNQNNLGFAAACNQGARLASGEFLLFLNSDARLNEATLKALAEVFESSPKVGIAAPKLIDETAKDEPFAFGCWPTWLGLLRGNLKTDASRADWVSGAALAIRRVIFESLGGFDERFFMYFEDVDLCWRTKALGYDIVISEAASVVHQRGASNSDERLRKKYYRRSQMLYFKKHLGLHP